MERTSTERGKSNTRGKRPHHGLFLFDAASEGWHPLIRLTFGGESGLDSRPALAFATLAFRGLRLGRQVLLGFR